MKTLFWYLSLLVLVSMTAEQVDGRLSTRNCIESDVDSLMISGTGARLEIGMEVVKTFVADQDRSRFNPFDGILDEGQKTKIMEKIQLNGLPKDMTYSGHHIIPFTLIAQELASMAQNRIFTDQMYAKVRQGLHRLIGTKQNYNLYKDKTWHAAIQKLKRDTKKECARGNIELSQAVLYVAQGLASMVRWTPNNIFVGPLGNVRADDPGDQMDNPILKTFTPEQQGKFTNLANGFSYQVNKYYTIVELMADIDKGPGIWGPVWEKISPPDPRYSQKVWRVKKPKLNTSKKICSVDFINNGPEKKCEAYKLGNVREQGKPYVGIKDGMLFCLNEDRAGTTNAKFRSLCEG